MGPITLDVATWPPRVSGATRDHIIRFVGTPNSTEDIPLGWDPADGRKFCPSMSFNEADNERICLMPDTQKQAVLCRPCKLLASGTFALRNGGLKKWEHAHDNLRSHESGEAHKRAMCD